MSHFGIINCVHKADENRLCALLRNEGAHILYLHGDNIHDAASFLRQVERELPMPPELEPHNWDAFADCLWSGLAEIAAAHVAVLWTEADRMLHGGLPDLLTAVSCFEQTARSVGTTEYGFPHPLLFQVFLLGEGENFPPLRGKQI